MKKSILITMLLCVLLIGCNSDSQQSKKVKSEFESAVESANKSDVAETDLFLGFKFGMTEDEELAHFRKLYEDEKIYLNSKNKYQFDFTSESGMKYYLTFSSKYHNGELYRKIYWISSDIAWDELGYMVLFKSFSDNSNGFKNFIIEDDFGETTYYAIKDNIVVTFMKTSISQMMIYENAPIAVMAKEEEEKLKREEYEKSASEF